MTSEFLSRDIWPKITKAVRCSRQRCEVAVAYFGKGASRLLPLPKGSCLVVDASDRAVASGQTCPTELLKLLKHVTIYTVPNLHAKVFVVDRAVFIGSTNASFRSATQLREAVIRTTEPSVVRDARKFLRENYLDELGPEALRRLVKIYRPPKISGGKRGKRHVHETSSRATIPRVILAQLELENWSKPDQVLHDKGLTVARKRRLHPRSYILDDFRCSGKCDYFEGDKVVQVIDEGNGKVLVTTPGYVRYIRTRQNGKRRVSFVYLERSARRRRKLKVLAHILGCTKKRLREDGVIQDQSFARNLLNTLAIKS
jgi:hypothetical protein